MVEYDNELKGIRKDINEFFKANETRNQKLRENRFNTILLDIRGFLKTIYLNESKEKKEKLKEFFRF